LIRPVGFVSRTGFFPWFPDFFKVGEGFGPIFSLFAHPDLSFYLFLCSLASSFSFFD